MHPILKLLAQRLALGIVLLFAASVLIFVGTTILPGDVAQSILGQSATPQALANLRTELGLNDPPVARYFAWLGGVLQGDLGTALTNGRDISESLGGRFRNTMFLAFWAAVGEYEVWTVHLEGAKNCAADLLSRWHLDPHSEYKFLALRAGHSSSEVRLPRELFQFSGEWV